MEIATLIKKLLLIGVVVVALLIFLFWWGFYRTQATDISQQIPYASIIGKEVVAKYESYIALNYEPFVNENPYVLQMHDSFYSEAGNPYKLPIGTIFKIEYNLH
ncbi:hypothetical protein [uncultured Maribacter sp.]|uniref:hypothetical protein n=1 Tax=uncultured Maribacter sp. TaxID=431308 RepID=UPI0026186C96|nr:hypothetical protein [uncultured Maribacter sp.]